MLEAWFSRYSSNTLAASGNQYVFASDGMPHTGRIWFRLTQGGRFSYSILFSNTIDSTFDDGSVSRKNDRHTGWKLLRVAAAVSGQIANGAELIFHELRFDGTAGYDVTDEAVLFATDPVELSAQTGDYLCLEITYAGERLPYFEECLVSSFRKEGDEWLESKELPFPAMIGCDRPTDIRIGYFGDSITQGIGTERDSYAHWNAVLSDRLMRELPGKRFAFWNLGLGFGRAEDAASHGIWLEKAKHNDIVIVCFGVNDLLQNGEVTDRICSDLSGIVDALKDAGVTVLLQTVPPFDYDPVHTERWQRINRFILSDGTRADAVFDNVPVLGKGPDHPEQSRFGGHPDAEGCARWAEALYPVFRDLLES